MSSLLLEVSVLGGALWRWEAPHLHTLRPWLGPALAKGPCGLEWAEENPFLGAPVHAPQPDHVCTEARAIHTLEPLDSGEGCRQLLGSSPGFEASSSSSPAARNEHFNRDTWFGLRVF